MSWYIWTDCLAVSWQTTLRACVGISQSFNRIKSTLYRQNKKYVQEGRGNPSFFVFLANSNFKWGAKTKSCLNQSRCVCVLVGIIIKAMRISFRSPELLCCLDVNLKSSFKRNFRQEGTATPYTYRKWASMGMRHIPFNTAEVSHYWGLNSFKAFAWIMWRPVNVYILHVINWFLSWRLYLMHVWVQVNSLENRTYGDIASMSSSNAN